MSKFIDLLNREVRKINKYMVLAIGAYLILQTLIVHSQCQSIYDNISMAMKTENISRTVASIRYGVSINTVLNNSRSFFLGFAFLIMLIFVYSLVIWYREWFGNNKTIYTLLALPINRVNIYLAKLTTIAYMFICAIATFITAFFIDIFMIQKIFTKTVITNQDIYKALTGNTATVILKPDIRELIALILITAGLISMIFLFIMLERSYKLKGALIGMVLIFAYCFGAIMLLENSVLYSIEKLIAEIIYGLVVTIISIIIGNKLLKSKVSV